MLLPVLPHGFTARSVTLEDGAAVSAVVNANYEYYALDLRFQPSAFVSEWTTPQHDLANNSIVVLDSTDRIVAYADVWAFMNPPVRPQVEFSVHPEFHASELAAPLLAWAEERARAHIALCPPDQQIALRAGSNTMNLFKQQALEAAGFNETRRFYRMRIDLAAAPVEIPLPAGYHYEPYEHPEQIVALIEQDRRSFQDHFGYHETNFDEEVAEIRHYFDTLPHFDASLFNTVYDDATHTLVAATWNLMEDDADPASGYIDSVGVLREHRGKGIALAMLTRAFSKLYARGKHSIALGVDADSLTGALRLYEKVGMRPVLTSIRYEKVLREGIDMTTQTINA